MKLTDEEEVEIERGLAGAKAAQLVEKDVPVLIGAAADYVAVAQALLPQQALAGWRVVLDTANGATCGTSPVVFRALGAETEFATPEQFLDTSRRETVKWAKIIKDSGAKID